MKKLVSIILSVLFSSTIFAQDLLTIGEVFDFNIGDKLQTEGHGLGQPPNADRITIIDKYYTTDSNTVSYVRYHDSYYTTVEFYELVYHFWTETDTVSYSNLDSCITDFSYWTSYDTIMVSYDTINSSYEDYCDSTINGYSFQMYTFEPVYLTRLFGKGLGEVRDYYYVPAEFQMFDNVLFYYEKNGISCGIPDNTVSIQENEQENDFMISPNPAVNYFDITNKSGNQFDLEIYTITGELIISRTFEKCTTFFDCSSLSPGMYFVCFSQESKRWSRKLIIN